MSTTGSSVWDGQGWGKDLWAWGYDKKQKQKPRTEYPRTMGQP